MATGEPWRPTPSVRSSLLPSSRSFYRLLFHLGDDPYVPNLAPTKEETPILSSSDGEVDSGPVVPGARVFWVTRRPGRLSCPVPPGYEVETVPSRWTYPLGPSEDVSEVDGAGDEWSTVRGVEEGRGLPTVLFPPSHSLFSGSPRGSRSVVQTLSVTGLRLSCTPRP